MNATSFFGAALCGLLVTAAPAAEFDTSSTADPILFESATLGPLGDFGGYGIFDACFVGIRFEVREPTVVTAIGSHLNRYHGNSVFGTLVSLNSPTGFPSGLPFAPYEVVAADRFELSEPISSDYVFPLSAQLVPGHYGVIFGRGLFGDPTGGGYVVMPLNNVDRPDTGGYFQWNGTKWEESRAQNVRLVVYGSPNPVLQIARPSSAQIVLSWPAVFTNCVLETCQAMPPSNQWTAVTNACTVEGTRLVLTNSIDVISSRFYRLRKQ